MSLIMISSPEAPALPAPAACDSVYELLSAQALSRPIAVALTAPGRVPITYRQLAAHVRRSAATLHRFGLGTKDRVAVVLPNGPELAAAFLAISAATTFAPLNPEYRASEFEFYLSDLQARALIIQAGLQSPARQVALDLGIPIIELKPLPDEPAGLFTLHGMTRPSPGQTGLGRESDVALVLHTSGTTSRPKIVPLTHANLCTSARNIQAAFELGPKDRCLNIMPLFHIHGLVGAVLSSISAGASVVCSPGFNAPLFFPWLEESRPSWYTAVPSMHQGILARTAANREIISRCPLRFIRSCSSPLAPQLMMDLEKAFAVPVIESYGMTEASHQMASNPLPPLPRKPGSVGKATGIRLAVLGEGAAPLPPGKAGEVVIKGPNVTSGYDRNPQANSNSFTGGWFRTGDQGYLDADGYLFLTGRIKEIINRGGEKISPREVDEVLLEHPAVEQALTFAIPDLELGEEVGAAVVMRAEATVTEYELCEYAAGRLAPFKVPRRVALVREIPKGPTGKPQRIGLAEKLGITSVVRPRSSTSAYVRPHTPTEKKLEEVFCRLLRVERVGSQGDFFQAGGDSMLATALLAEIHRTFGKNLSHVILLQGATIKRLGDVIDGNATTWSTLVPLQPHGDRPPFFCVHPVGGDVCTLLALGRHFHREQPFYGIQSLRPVEGGAPARLEEMAARYLTEIRRLQPHGPYYLGGYSMGGVAAFEIAQQLRRDGQQVNLLAILDSSAPGKLHFNQLWRPGMLRALIQDTYHWMMDDLRHAGWKSLWGRIRLKTRAWMKRLQRGLYRSPPGEPGIEKAATVFDVSCLPEDFRQTVAAHYRAMQDYVPEPYEGRLTLFRARAQSPFRSRGADLGWRPLSAGGLDIIALPGSHDSFVQEPLVRLLAEKLQTSLREAQDCVVSRQ
jgi:acyl-CoA synthetase (AMP-forming)/AMP-acid ligase II/thioesterase domain-containing protein